MRSWNNSRRCERFPVLESGSVSFIAFFVLNVVCVAWRFRFFTRCQALGNAIPNDDEVASCKKYKGSVNDLTDVRDACDDCLWRCLMVVSVKQQGTTMFVGDCGCPL